jgi:hypothetical protein
VATNSALQKAAPFGIEIVEQLLTVQLEFGAIAIVTCAHCEVLPVSRYKLSGVTQEPPERVHDKCPACN